MKKSLRREYPYLLKGIALIVVGIAIFLSSFMYYDRIDVWGRLILGVVEAAFIVSGVLTCFSKRKKKEVFFRSKSSWQKDDCINRSADYNCPNPSTLEAVCGDSIVRCCEEEECKKRAAELAKLY